MIRSSLKLKLTFIILIFALSCVLITSVLLQHVAYQNIEANILNKNLIISRMISDQIDIYLEDAKSTVVTAANFSSQSYGDLPQIEKEIFRIYDNFDYFDLIFYMNSDAKMVFAKPSNDHVKNRVYNDRNYYWEVLNENRTTISPLLISSVLKMPHFIIAAPVHNNSGQVSGLIGAGLPLSNIIDIVEKTQKAFNGKIWVTDASGVFAVHPDIDNDKELIKLDNKNVFKDKIETDFLSVLKEKEETIITYNIENTKCYGAVTFVPNANWMIVVEQDEDTVFSQVFQMKEQLKDVILIVIIGALITGLIFALRITKPIEALVKKVKALSYDFRNADSINIDRSSYNEIHELSKAFNDMSVRLKHNLLQLEQSYIRENELQQYLNNILKSVANGILVIDKDRKITIFNKAAESISGFDSKEFIGKNIDNFLDTINSDLGAMIENVLNENKIIADVEVTMKGSKNEEIPISISASQVKDNNKNEIGVVILFRDMSRIKEIEEELRREDRVRTLGELSASIIHDIGNPLAGISNLVEVLKDNTLDEEIKKEVLDVLEKEMADLNTLVINFLNFSRTSKLEEEIININELIENLIRLLRIEIISKKIRINRIYSKQPILIKIDKRAIKQALLNIIKNSIQAVDEKGEISIRLVKGEDRVTIFISDNGMGMDEQKVEKIFNPFFTTKKDGTGLGLSIAYKLIKDHKGHIAVKSKPNIGTEFAITLPSDKKDLYGGNDL